MWFVSYIENKCDHVPKNNKHATNIFFDKLKNILLCVSYWLILVTFLMFGDMYYIFSHIFVILVALFFFHTFVCMNYIFQIGAMKSFVAKIWKIFLPPSGNFIIITLAWNSWETFVIWCTTMDRLLN